MDKFGNFVDFPVAPTVMEDVAFAIWGPSTDAQFHPSGQWLGYRPVEDNDIVEIYRLYTGAGGRTLTGPKITCHLTKNYSLSDIFRFGRVRDVAVVIFWRQGTTFPTPVNFSWDILELTDTTCTVKHYTTTGNCPNDVIAPAWGFVDQRGTRFIANEVRKIYCKRHVHHHLLFSLKCANPFQQQRFKSRGGLSSAVLQLHKSADVLRGVLRYEPR
eukprot:CAMPEP_0184371530 /NCGR_PEP_ID=MMETSP1089-20130417/163450_1 /TAXON_ID=38269 ORGANISM="Gloeochaete wittrockiana, Strain SAG46.84" /NCGR_SAMPLE_ID=MMETSP1089 /ASSEMBLY_ACC=CAM_ASM_000445 /LENGTH=214 /DNA_ID=CAMNT_0026714297 /DNA_START=15 /DNA_END=662 /DNA_ORIENTATION=-